MKRVLLMIGLCMAVTTAFAQKKAVSEAERISKDPKPDFNEARTLVKGALENPETMNDAKTWYIAAQIEDAQFTVENTKQILGQQPNEPVMYDALQNSLPYFLKAYELDQLPNEKGKVKPKYTKNIKNTLNANHVYYMNGGIFYFEKGEYKKACDFWEQYLQIADLPFITEEKATTERDSTYMSIQFYLSVAATQVNDSEYAIKNLERAKTTPYRQSDVYQYLYGEYQILKDTASMQRTLEEGYMLFPDTNVFVLNLINLYIYQNENEKAVDLLTKAIDKDPNNADLYQAMGSVYESGLKNYDKAEIYYKRAAELDNENTIMLSNIGRIYYNQAVNKLGEASLISDAVKYNEERGLAKDLFRKALPYFQKAHEKEPESIEYMTALRGIYYNLDMGKEFDEIDAKMNNE
ncbi:MAG: tetratricopeptide repeat protein [Tannerella sp.]|jgi:tetratricopeptide (TPR) repeat protein|nr:tetratricopeptide repeat protein [Tannerella sp.]